MKLIRVGKRFNIKFTIVDNEMYNFLSQFRWVKSGNYVVTRFAKQNIAMHHLVTGFPLNRLVVDHINRNPLDNRKENLRVVTMSINSKNSDHSRYCRGTNHLLHKKSIPCLTFIS